MDDIRHIDVKHFDPKRVPNYLMLSAGMILLGLLLIIAGIVL
jgi:hypothetical protein